jgi:hypothetical protein
MAALLLILSLALADKELKDGETVLVDSDALFGTELYYTFNVGSVNNSDLVFTLTSFSDFSDPDMYLKLGKKPTYDNFDYKSISWGSGSIVLNPSEVKANSEYHLLIMCYTLCKFGITASMENEIQLTPGLPISGQVEKGHQLIYQYLSQPDDGNSLTITASQIKGKLRMFVVIGANKEPTSDTSESVETTWDNNLQFKSSKFQIGTVFRVAMMAEKNSTFTLLVDVSKAKANQLQAGVTVSGEVATSEMIFYVIQVMSSSDVLSISLTVLSGDADIYVSAGGLPTVSQYNFSSVHGGNENLVITGVDRENIGKPTGNYFIGIYGLLHSTFTLNVRTSNSSFIKLEPGNPQTGCVNQSSMVYFYIDYPDADANITAVLIVESGNPDLFCKSCEDKLKKCTISPGKEEKGLFWASEHISGSESIEIAHKSGSCNNKKGKKCHYIFGVYGISDYSTFNLLVTTNSTDEIILQDGIPTILNVAENTQKYFKFMIFNETVSEVVFMLTPIYGDTDIYGSFNQPIQYIDYQKSSINAGVDTDQIKWVKGVDSDSLKGVYHLFVFGTYASSYSIVAKTTIPSKNTTIQIYPGHPQKDTVYNYTNRDYRIYTFPIHFTEDTKQKISISLTAITGRFTLYVANKISNIDWKKEIFYYNWKSTSTSHSDLSTSVVINPSNEDFLLDSTYAVLVMADKFLPDLSATYVISFSIGNGSVLLSEDIPFTGIVLKEEYSYFMFPVHYSTEDITISLTCLSGDSDLYISVNPNNTHPSITQFDFIASTFEDEKLGLTWDQIKPICSGVPSEYVFGNKSHCYVFISVYGFDSSTFIIRVHPLNNLPSMLTLGQPLAGNLSELEYAFYYTFVDVAGDFKITVQPETGDPDLFLNVFDKDNVSSNSSTWIRPTKDNAQFLSVSTVMTEVIQIKAADLRNWCKSGICLLMASVFCIDNCSYFVQTSQTNQSQVLMENEPTYATSFQEFVYFSYYCSEDESEFSVQVTPLNDGNPDLYVNKGSDNYPTQDNFVWASDGWGGDSIIITKDDPYFKSSSQSMRGNYIIGVKDFWGNCSFTILVNNRPTKIHKLVSGVPQYGNLTGNSLVYYSFFNTILDDVSISLSVTLGNAEIFVRIWYVWDGDIIMNLPSPEKFTWSSSISKDKYRITIPTSSDKFCTYCSYLIAVITSDSPAVYTITAQTEAEITLLQDGSPVRSTVTIRKWRVFSIEILNPSDIFISFTPYIGSANIFVSKNESLIWENFFLSSYSVQSTQNLQINKTSPEFKVGTFYIVIEADLVDSSFSLVAHSENSFIYLLDGLPVYYSVPGNSKESVIFKFTADHGHFVYCYIKSFIGQPPSVYTKFQSLKDSPAKPKEGFSDSKYGPSSYTELYSQESQNISYLAFSNIHTGPKTQLNIGVYPSNKSESIEFEIHCSGTTESSILKTGSTDIGILDDQISSKRYEVSTSEKGTLDAYVIPCIGQFKLEISSNWTIASQDIPDIVAPGLIDGVLAGSVNHALGSYYLTVSVSGQKVETSVYEFMTVFTKSGETAKKPYKPGNSGLLQWKDLKKQKKVRVSWQGLVDDNGKSVNETVDYRVYFTEKEEGQLLTACGILYHATFAKVKFLGVSKTDTLDVHLPSRKGFINVLAMVNKNSNSAIKRVVYDPTEVSISKNRPPRDIKLLFFLLVTLLILALATSIYFYKKKKKAENILNFEMNDVRNVAGMTNAEVPGKRPDPYSPLS